MRDIPREREDWYIAAPFFNKEQIAVVEQIENVLTESARRCFSPRMSVPSVAAKQYSLTAELVKRIFDVNIDVLNVRCNLMVAYFGWELPEDRAVMEVSIERRSDQSAFHDPTILFHREVKGPLNIPDSGTVWEVGYASAGGIPVFGIFGKGQKPNLMLSQSCIACFENVESFRVWLQAYDTNPNILYPKWKGPQL